MENSEKTRVKYAQIGIGGRARMYYEALCSTYMDTCDLVADVYKRQV